MMRAWWVTLFACVACGNEPPLAVLAATCGTHEDNALRVRCELTLSRPSALVFTYEPVDGSLPPRSVASSEDNSVVAADFVLMAPDTIYTWTATLPGVELPALAMGTVRTGLPPFELLGAVTMTGTSSASMVGFGSPCLAGAYAQIYATDGRILWYQSLGGVAAFAEAISFTEDQTVLAIVGSKIREFSLLGEVLFEVGASDLSGRFHHDVFRKDGLTWAITNDTVEVEGEELLLDAFVVFDRDGDPIADWRLADHHEPLVFDETSRDYSHMNSIWVDDNDGVLLSMRHLSSIIRVHADIDSPRFGEIDWWMVGDGATDFGMAFGSDFEIVSDVAGIASFQQQHNVHLLPDGRMALFDNGVQRDARLAVLRFDVQRGTVAIDESYDLFQTCPFQGGAWHTAAGHPMATCAPSQFRRAVEWNPEAPEEPVWEAIANCVGEIGAEEESAGNVYIPRFVPLEW